MSETIENRVIAAFNSQVTDSLTQTRSNAIEAFEKLGIPTRRTEAWKYTPVRKAFTEDLQFTTPLSATSAEPVNTLDFLNAHKLVFVDGVYNKSLSTTKTEAAGVIVTSLQQGFEAKHPAVEQHFNKYLQNDIEPLSALNTAFLKDGAFVFAPKNTALEFPVLVIHVSSEENSNSLKQPRNLIVAETGSQIQVVEYTIDAGFVNQATEVVVADNAIVDWYNIQTQNVGQHYINTVQAVVGRTARFNNWNINLGGAIVRNNVNVDLNGEGGETYLNGMYYLDGTSHVDNHLYVSHNVPHCYSNQLYKGLLDDKSTGVFNGKVYVKQDAQKTNAFQSNKNILLSDNATINTKPELEIYADDVKCSHGATTGQIDEQMLFYLRARGLDRKQAISILNQAFIGEVIATVNIPELKEWLTNLVERKFNEGDE